MAGGSASESFVCAGSFGAAQCAASDCHGVILFLLIMGAAGRRSKSKLGLSSHRKPVNKQAGIVLKQEDDQEANWDCLD